MPRPATGRRAARLGCRGQIGMALGVENNVKGCQASANIYWSPYALRQRKNYKSLWGLWLLDAAKWRIWTVRSWGWWSTSSRTILEWIGREWLRLRWFDVLERVKINNEKFHSRSSSNKRDYVHYNTSKLASPLILSCRWINAERWACFILLPFATLQTSQIIVECHHPSKKRYHVCANALVTLNCCWRWNPNRARCTTRRTKAKKAWERSERKPMLRIWRRRPNGYVCMCVLWEWWIYRGFGRELSEKVRVLFLKIGNVWWSLKKGVFGTAKLGIEWI